jgi:hypothetical protein
MSGKKPVWVDESAHAILKEYASLTKTSMVETASRLVLEKLSQLDVAAAAAAEAEASSGPISVQKPVTVKATTTNRRRKARSTVTDLNSPDVRFVGGVWLV